MPVAVSLCPWRYTGAVYIFTDYKDLTNPIFNFIKHKVISSYDKIIDDTSVDVVMVLDDNDACLI